MLPLPHLLQLLFISATLGMFSACSSADERAHELYSIAELEEEQRNLEHATQLYKELIDKYPHTPWADQAAARLHEIEGP